MTYINYHRLVEGSLDAICQLNQNGLIEYASPSSLEVIGWSPEELVGRRPSEFILAEDVPPIAAEMASFAMGQMEQARVTVRCLGRDGSVRWIETTAKMMRDPDTSESIATVLVQRDVTERKALEDKLVAMALQDGLTGLANRRAFDQALEREWRRTLRDDLELSLLLLDVDRFKAFNDQYGHLVGDDCLRAISVEVARMGRRPSDLTARYGGEELAIILPNTGSEGAWEVAEQIREAILDLRLPHAGNPDGGGWVTASIGVATSLPRNGGTASMPTGLLAAADSALYKAKSSGRNRAMSTIILAPTAP